MFQPLSVVRSVQTNFVFLQSTLNSPCRPPRQLSFLTKQDHSCAQRFPTRRWKGRIFCGLELDYRRRGVYQEAAGAFYEEQLASGPKTVAVFWDLDNKPPNSVPAYDAALRLRNIASELGEVVDMVAYANKSAFTHVPERVREERQDRRLLDQLEKRGLVAVDQPYICNMCGRKCKTNLDLKKHFRQLHERERNKRMAHLGTLKGKKRDKFLQKNSGRETRYKEAARTVIVPRVGYGLAPELKRAGVHVRTVESKPQAADLALINHMNLYIHRGLDCLVLVSDDTDFVQTLRYARQKRLFTVVVGDTYKLRRAADTSLLWEDVASGRARFAARESLQRWINEESLRMELLNQAADDEFDHEPEEGEYTYDNEGRHFRSRVEETHWSIDYDDDEGEDQEPEEEEDSYDRYSKGRVKTNASNHYDDDEEEEHEDYAFEIEDEE